MVQTDEDAQSGEETEGRRHGHREGGCVHAQCDEAGHEADERRRDSGGGHPPYTGLTEQGRDGHTHRAQQGRRQEHAPTALERDRPGEADEHGADDDDRQRGRGPGEFVDRRRLEPEVEHPTELETHAQAAGNTHDEAEGVQHDREDPSRPGDRKARQHVLHRRDERA